MAIACVDVQYGVMRGAKAAVVAFAEWNASIPLEQHVIDIAHVEPYEPGSFYKRELPCIRAALGALSPSMTIDIVIVDAHVWLERDPKSGVKLPGLGARLLDADPSIKTVVGVAKTRFREAPAKAILRGDSATPLWVDEAGVPVDAEKRVVEMHGKFRVPTLLRLVDQLARGIR